MTDSSETPPAAPPSALKKSIFALLPLIILAAAAEIGLRVIHFHIVHKEPLAIVAAFKTARRSLLLKQAQRSDAATLGELRHALFSPVGEKLRQDMYRQYEEYFRTLAEEAENIGTKLIVLYVPQDNSGPDSESVELRAFYRSLAEKYNVEYLDVADQLFAHSKQTVYLLPINGHFSRFGNQLVAEALNDYLKKYREARMQHSFSYRPDFFGDQPPGRDEIRYDHPDLPYRLITNSQGLRDTEETAMPKSKQRVLVLGDSYTFGPYLPNADTYPAQLERLDDSREILNAGVAGYTIADEVALFQERAKYTEPDITLLQVLDNDVFGLFFKLRNQYDRQGKVYQPSQLEEEFLKSVEQ
jgi:lysophospholipase L1-like esterase